MKQANKGSLPSISAANSWFIQKEWIFFSILKAKRGSRSITTVYNKLNTTQALYSNAISKVVHIQEQILYHFNIRQDPWDYIHRHKDGWASQSLQAYEPVFTLWNIVTARGEYTNGCLCHGNSFRICQSLFLGIYIYIYIYVLHVFYIYIYCVCFIGPERWTTFQKSFKTNLSTLEKDSSELQPVFSFFICSYHLCFLGKTHAAEKVLVLHWLFLNAILRAPPTSFQQCLKQWGFVRKWLSDSWQPF